MLWGDIPLLLPGPVLPGLCCKTEVTDPGPGLCDRRGPGLWRGDECCCIMGEGDGDIIGDCGVEGWWMGDDGGGPRGEWISTDCCWGAFELRLGGPIRRLGGPTFPGTCCWRCFCCCLLRYSCKQQVWKNQLKHTPKSVPLFLYNRGSQTFWVQEPFLNL